MTETTTHGTLPWVQPNYDRRSLVYKFSPGNSACAYQPCAHSSGVVHECMAFEWGVCADSPGVGQVTYPAWVDQMTQAQRDVLQQPSLRRAKI
jgi:hypothetical protein